MIHISSFSVNDNEYDLEYSHVLTSNIHRNAQILFKSRLKFSAVGSLMSSNVVPVSVLQTAWKSCNVGWQKQAPHLHCVRRNVGRELERIGWSGKAGSWVSSGVWARFIISSSHYALSLSLSGWEFNPTVVCVCVCVETRKQGSRISTRAQQNQGSEMQKITEG